MTNAGDARGEAWWPLACNRSLTSGIESKAFPLPFDDGFINADVLGVAGDALETLPINQDGTHPLSPLLSFTA